MPGKRQTKLSTTTLQTESVTPVVMEVQAPMDVPVVSATQVAGAKTRGKKKVEAVKTETPLEVKAEVKADVKHKRGGKAKVAEVAVVEAQAQVQVQDGGKPKPKSKAKTKKTEDTTSEAKVDSTEPVVASADQSEEKHIRSFKVLLPGQETYEGRFTGLTPYQAANKALSKYFREGERSDTAVTFSICESTRKSKKSVYTYVGQRHKLEAPVRYTIQDGREIVKNFKNTLKKVKKSETESSAPTVSA